MIYMTRQIKQLTNRIDKKSTNIYEHYFMEGYCNKELEFKIFKIRLTLVKYY